MTDIVYRFYLMKHRAGVRVLCGIPKKAYSVMLYLEKIIIIDGLVPAEI